MQEVVVKPGKHNYTIQVTAFDDIVKELEAMFTVNVVSVDFDISTSTNIIILDSSEYKSLRTLFDIAIYIAILYTYSYIS